MQKAFSFIDDCLDTLFLRSPRLPCTKLEWSISGTTKSPLFLPRIIPSAGIC